MSLTDVQGAYYAMGILLSISGIVLLTEAIINLSKARKMTGNHSGGYSGDSHVVQMNTVKHSAATEVMDSNGFTSVEENGGGFQFTSMFHDNSETQLAPPY